MNYKSYMEQGENVLTIEEMEAKKRAEAIEKSRYEFHVNMDFDAAVKKLEEFDQGEPFVPCEIRKYGAIRVCFRVFEQYFIRTEGYASLSVLMEESPRFGVDVLAIVSGAGQGVYNIKEGVNEDFVNQLKRHMGVAVPKVSLKDRAKRFFLE